MNHSVPLYIPCSVHRHLLSTFNRVREEALGSLIEKYSRVTPVTLLYITLRVKLTAQALKHPLPQRIQALPSWLLMFNPFLLL